MRFEYARRFANSLQRLPMHDRHRVTEAIEQIVTYCETRQAPQGLGLKKLFSREALGAAFEARVSVAARLLFTVKHDVVTFLIVSDHDEVRRFIKSTQRR